MRISISRCIQIISISFVSLTREGLPVPGSAFRTGLGPADFHNRRQGFRGYVPHSGDEAPFLPPLPVLRAPQKAAHTAPTDGLPGGMGGDYRVFPPRERGFSADVIKKMSLPQRVSTLPTTASGPSSKGVDPCFLRLQVVRLQTLVQETRVFSDRSHSTPIPRLLEFPFL
jgi:hypothetical protein